MFGLISHGTDFSAEEILTAYQQRDWIEKNYDNMKNELEISRLHVQSNQAMEGKFFIGFIAQILWASLTNAMYEKKKFHEKMPVETVERLLLKMNQVQVIQNDTGTSLMRPLTKLQKNILEMCDIKIDDFLEKISALHIL